ncbi:unnamed protein product [Adineta ricciae]|uniref:Uncharacterized protein n=1 Tax=Adineta ricciae TaxID=249248 RepID=A0A816DXQ9_ADIRI|nr:unnamed protein product [Adineta ricciae]CAF1640110.1 unnamed protein product [Adineta ricciae]
MTSHRIRSYETTYQREYSIVRKATNIDEGVPAGQRFLIGCPYELNEPVGITSYTDDYPEKTNIQREPIIRPNTPRANRPHTHPQFPYIPRQSVITSSDITEKIKQALKSQFTTTYRTDFLGAPQGFPLPLAYNSSRSFWRNRAYQPSNSEQKCSLRPTTAPVGRYAYTRRAPAEAIIPLTLPMWRKGSSQTSYKTEFSEKAPSELYMKNFVDHFSGPMDQQK